MKATHIANPVRVEAHVIKAVERGGTDMAGGVCFAVELENGKHQVLTPGQLARYIPVPGDYLVTQDDGYQYINPKDVFERKYSPVGPIGEDGPLLADGGDFALRRPFAQNFGYALEAVRRGQRVARAGWNGKGQFVYLVPPASYPVQTGAAKAHFGEGSMVPYNAYLALKTVDERVSTWVPSVSDCLADDWLIVE